MTLGDFRLSIQNKLGLQASGDELTLLDAYVNRGVLQVCTDLTPGLVFSTITLSNGIQSYFSSSLVIAEAYQDGPTLPITRLSHRELIERRQANPLSAQFLTHYSFLGSVIWVYPTPISSSPVLSIIHQVIPANMTATGDSPTTASFGGVPVEFHEGIELWALSQAADIVDDAESGAGQKYKNEYYEWLALQEDVLGRKGGQWNRGLSSHPMSLQQQRQSSRRQR